MAEQENTKVDLSKVRNLAATGDTALMKKIGKTKKKTKFNFDLSAEKVPLPSGGKFYNTDDADIQNGYILLTPMTVKEEEILSTQRFLKKGIATRMILDNCIQSNIEAKDLLSFDSNFLLFALRQISYGDDYTFTLKCENSSCNKEFKHTVYISQFEFNEIPEEIEEEPIVIELPKTKYTVSLILPRIFHAEQIQLSKDKRKDVSTSDVDTIFIDQLLATTISIVSPEGEEVSPKDWKDFYEEIPTFDRAVISEKVRLDAGFDKLDGVECPHCGTEQGGVIPIGIEFFRL